MLNKIIEYSIKNKSIIGFGVLILKINIHVSFFSYFGLRTSYLIDWRTVQKLWFDVFVRCCRRFPDIFPNCQWRHPLPMLRAWHYIRHPHSIPFYHQVQSNDQDVVTRRWVKPIKKGGKIKIAINICCIDNNLICKYI